MKQKTIFILITVLILSFTFPLTVHATNGITKIDEFENLEAGDGQYIKYSDNYQLDMKKVSMFDKDKEMVNTIANFFFGIFKEISYLTIVVFYHCFSFDISEMFGVQLNSIQTTLRNIFFDGGIFLIVFATSAFYIIKQLFRGNLQDLLGEVFKVLAILIISMAVATESSAFLHFVNVVAKQISVEALGGISGQEISSDDENSSLKKYAADAAGMLWSGLVHKPWLALEFGGDYGGNIERNTKDILSTKRASTERKDLIEKLNKDEGLFGEEVGAVRLISAFVMMLPILTKDIFYLIIALLQISFQVFTLFYIIICPLVLILAVSPQLGGAELIWFWLKKIVETQLSILILTFIIGIIIKYDDILSRGNTLGWLIGLWLQVFVMVALVLNWHKVLIMLTRATRSIQNPRLALAMHQMRQSGGLYVGAFAGGVYGMQHIGGMAGEMSMTVGSAVGNGISGAWDSMVTNYKANYNNVQQYKPPKSPPQLSHSSPKTNSVADSSVKEKTETNVLQKKDKVIDFDKIPKYQNNRRDIDALQRPVSYKVDANKEDLHKASKNNSEDTKRADTANYSTRAVTYTTKTETSSVTAQRPHTAKRKQDSINASTSEQTQLASTQKPASGRADLQQQKRPIRTATTISDSRQFTPKPVVNEFKFDSSRAIDKKGTPIPRHSSATPSVAKK